MQNYELEGPALVHDIEENVGLGERFFSKMDTFKDKINQVDSESGMTETVGSVKNRAIQVAMELQKHQIGLKTNILIICRTHMDHTVALLGGLFVGAVIASVDPEMSHESFYPIMKAIKPKLIFCDQRAIGMIEKSFKEIAMPPCPMYVFGLGREHSKTVFSKIFQQKFDPDFKPVGVTNPKETPAFLCVTEGTTGPPKIMSISHHAVLIRCTHMQLVMGRSRRVIAYFSLMGNAQIILTCTSFDMPMVRILPHVFSEREVCRIIHGMKIEFALLGTEKALKLAKYLSGAPDYEISYLKRILVGGGPTSPKNIMQITKAFPNIIVNIYGASECGFIAGSMDDSVNLNEIPGSCGKLFPGVKIKLVDVVTGQPVGVDTWGEIWCKHQGNILGYHQTNLNNSLWSKGYVKTGDIAQYDLTGCLFIKGRINDVFTVDGHSFSASDIEEVISEYTGILEVCVIGSSKGIEACVVKQDSLLRSEDLYGFLKDNLPEYKMPHKITFLSELSKTRNGKMQKYGITNIKPRLSIDNN